MFVTKNNLFLSKQNNKYGFVDKYGNVVVDYIYDDAREQNEFGYASVKKNGMWGCIDSKGKQVITPSYTLENASLIEFINKFDAVNEFVKNISLASTLSRQLRSRMVLHLIWLRNI